MLRMPVVAQFVILLSSLTLLNSCGSEQSRDTRGQNSPVLSGSGNAQDAIVYCDDAIQNQANTAYMNQPVPNAPQNRQGLPYEYPGQEQCMRGPDGEPIVDVRPGQPIANPGQRRDYRRAPVPPKNPNWQQPGTYPNNPNTPPNNPNWQQPGTYPNNPNNPNYQQPGNQNPEPLPY